MRKSKKRRAAREKLAKERAGTVPEGCELSQADWESMSETLRQHIHERCIELQDGIDRYREYLDSIRPWDEMAKASGTTLAEALERYTTFHQHLRANPVTATMQLWRTLGVDPLVAIAALRRRIGPANAH